MADIFKMATKRLTLARKTIRIMLKGLDIRYTEIQTKYKSDQNKLGYRRFSFCMVKYSQWQTFFKMAVKRLTLQRKTIRILLKRFHVSYTEIQTKYKSDHCKLRYRRFSFCMVKYRQWQTFSKMASKWLTLERKTIRTLLKGLHVSNTEIQTKYKSDHCKLRYRRFSF